MIGNSMKFIIYILSLIATAYAWGYTHLEPRQQNPVALTPDGMKLLALHSTAHSLSVFDVGNPPRSIPLLTREISLATAPVTVKARTNDEVWVVNEGSDSVSILSLAQGVIIDTLRVADEPADVVFANGKAFVSSAQARVISIFDAVTRMPLGQIPINGVAPRAMTASPDGTKVFVACLYSGNRTTILHHLSAPAQPAPTNPLLPAPPRVGVIVPTNDSRVTWNVLDQDIAEINTSNHTISRWISDVGTNLFSLAMHPDGSLWCGNSDSNNLIRFEPELKGEFIKHRLSKVALTSNTIVHHDLNPGILRATSPHSPSIAKALAAPMAFTFSSNGSSAWIAAFSSDRIAEVHLDTGAIIRRIDLRPEGTASDAMRGPRGIVLGNDRIYVVNKISDTLTTIRPSNGTILSEIPLGTIDPMPANIRAGRGALYDARLSGNGTISCASCHIDADRDGLAWDLGDPGGNMISVTSAGLSAHDFSLYTQSLHPMKGPLTTQTLRGLNTNEAGPIDPTDGRTQPAAAIVTKFHWRGDKPSIQSFNFTFRDLMGGNLQSAATMNRMNEYLRSIVHSPNPNLALDGSLRTNLPQGNAAVGKGVFLDHGNSHCVVCHGLPSGTNQNIDDPELVEVSQPMKNPSLRTVYQRFGLFHPSPGTSSISGFGLGSDGTGHAMPIVHPYFLSTINQDPVDQTALNHLTAFILSFDTGTAPTACYDLTITAANKNHASQLSQLATLEARANSSSNGLVAWGSIANTLRRFRWDTTLSRYFVEDEESSYSRTELLALIQAEDVMTFAGVFTHEVAWRSLDRNANLIPDVKESPPQIQLTQIGAMMSLTWPKADWFPETSSTLAPPWLPLHHEMIDIGDFWQITFPSPLLRQQFFRLRRTW